MSPVPPKAHRDIEEMVADVETAIGDGLIPPQDYLRALIASWRERGAAARLAISARDYANDMLDKERGAIRAQNADLQAALTKARKLIVSRDYEGDDQEAHDEVRDMLIEIDAALAAEPVSGDAGQGPPVEHIVADQIPYDVLPCDVRLPPNTTIRKGCTIPTLFAAIRQREGKDAKFPDAAGRARARALSEAEAIARDYKVVRAGIIADRIAALAAAGQPQGERE